MRASILAGTMAAAAVAIAVVLLFVTMARAHEVMGHFMNFGTIDYLYGKKIDDDTENKINCCKFEGGGDCTRLSDKDIQVVPGGFVWDGDFIPYSRSNVSPIDPTDGERYYYGCKHPPNAGWGAKPKPHCFFHIPSGS